MQHNEPVPIIFVTGGLGSGKSTFTRICAKNGFETLSADEIVDDLYENNREMVLRLKKLLGADIVDEDGVVSKSKIAERVFSDSTLLKEVESIIHPLVREVLNQHAKNADFLFYEIPVVSEQTDLSNADYVVVITADEATRINRAVSRGMKLEDAEKRIAAQQNNSFSHPRIIEIPNNGSVESFEELVNRFLKDILND